MKRKGKTNKSLRRLSYLSDEHSQTFAKTLKESSKVKIPRVEFPDYLLDAVKQINNLSTLTDVQLNIGKQVEELQKALTIPKQEMNAIAKLAENCQAVYSNLVKVELTSIKPILDFVDDYKASLRLVQKTWDEYFRVNQKLIENLAKSFDIRKDITAVGLNWLDAAEASIFVANRSIFQGRIRELKQYPSRIGKAVKNTIKLDKKDIEDFFVTIKNSIERHGIFAFWESKGGNKLRKSPERIAQALVSTNLYVLLPKERVIFDEQPQIGTGKIDILVTFFNGRGVERIVLELKVFEDGDNFDNGIKQTFNYLELQEVDFGFRFVFNASRADLQSCLHKDGIKALKDIIVDINPTAPSNL